MQRDNRSRDVCPHDVYIKGLCGNCGIRLDPPQSSSVSMIHSVPELKVSEKYAKVIGKSDQERLINDRKLVLLVDLDQTILHTTHERVKKHPDVHSFVLWPGHPTYYTKLRPYLKDFLEQMSKIYELHIFTFGCRLYAHKIASIIDPDQRYFGNRILSRDESVDQYSKRGNLNNLFPCGDAMVCIIDDRADVWRDAGNLIQVKPYSYFKTSISDGGPTNSSNSAANAEDDGSLDDDVDELEALLGIEDDDAEDDAHEAQEHDKQELADDNRVVDNANNSSGGEEDDEREARKKKRRDEGPKIASQNEETQVAPNEIEDSKPDDDSKHEETETESIVHDPDDHLLRLTSTLSRIHEKWYMELDEQRQFLVDGESYKLPDIKDIIKRYFKVRYD